MEGIPDIHLSLNRYQDETNGGIAEGITVKVGEKQTQTRLPVTTLILIP